MTLKIKRISGKQSVNLFLVELIAVLLFFSVSAAIILKMFAAANENAERSVVNEKMILCAQSLSEFYSESGNIDKTADKLFGAFYEKNDDVISVYMDKSFTAVPKNDEIASVMLVISENSEQTACGKLSRLNYEFFYKGDSFFSGNCSAYVPDFEVTANE